MNDDPKRYWTNNDYLRADFPLAAPTIAYTPRAAVADNPRHTNPVVDREQGVGDTQSERERVARIIDRPAWKLFDVDTGLGIASDHRTAVSLQKADAILTTLRAGGEVREADAWINSIPGVKASDQFIAADRRCLEAMVSRVLAGEVALRRAARLAHDTLIELNPSNYNHDDVVEANDAAVEAILLLADALGETHGKTPAWWEARRAALAPTPGGEA